MRVRRVAVSYLLLGCFYIVYISLCIRSGYLHLTLASCLSHGFGRKLHLLTSQNSRSLDRCILDPFPAQPKHDPKVILESPE